MKKDLQHIAQVLRKEETDYLELSNVLKKYKQMVHDISNFQPESKDERNNLNFENGMALGATWAAMCLDDMMRTKLFVKGLFEAVETARLNQKGPVHILYAGTGPFGTLILPVLASYSPSEVKCTLMEINDISFNCVQGVIKACGFNDHVSEFIQADATQVKINNLDKIDILLSETMQRALEVEQQVPIVINLLSQMRDDVILVPEKIDVVACLMNTGKIDRSELESDYCQRLGSVVELSKSSLNAHPYKHVGEHQLHFEEKTFDLDKDVITNLDQFALLTEIQIFGETWLRPYQSGLTMHKILNEFSQEDKKDLQVKMQYIVDNNPKIIFSELN